MREGREWEGGRDLHVPELGPEHLINSDEVRIPLLAKPRAVAVDNFHDVHYMLRAKSTLSIVIPDVRAGDGDDEG